jgi:hypothetical protein
VADNSSWTEHPLVSGLMVFSRPNQIRAAQAAAASFFAQDWPHKELVAYNTTDHRLVPLFGPKRRYREIKLRPRTPAQMLQLCLENASGEWCVHWQPDCFYDPRYITAHMRYREKRRLTLLRRQQVFALGTQQLAVTSSLTASCWGLYRHYPVSMETELNNQFMDVRVLDNQACLLTKFAHALT